MSRFEFKLPDIGEGVTEGEIVSWLVSEGDTVSEDQEMVEVMTDKATVTIGAPRAGKIAEIRGKEGDVIPVGEVLVVFEEPEEPHSAGEAPQPKGEETQPAGGPPTEPQGSDGAPTAAEAPARPEAPAEASAGAVATAVGDLRDELPGMAKGPPREGEEFYSEKPLAAPATRKLARELGIDLRRVRPSGPNGRITREDVERYRQGASAQPGAAAAQAPSAPGAPAARPAQKPPPRAAPAPQPPPPEPVAPTETEERVPIRGLRRRIYENMARAKHTAAHFTYVDECDVTPLKETRRRAKAAAAEEGVSLTFLPYIIKAVVASLKRHPELNCIVDDERQEMVLRKHFDIGVGVATEAGLTVPVLRGADRLSVLEIQRELGRLADEARAGKIRREDIGGSSFTITSLGKQGGLFATPVVNYPEVAILGVHEMKERPVVRDGEIVIGHVMLLSLSFDHRIIDGHVGARFAQEVISYLQEPDRLLLEMR